jgi:hypothetical protein
MSVCYIYISLRIGGHAAIAISAIHKVKFTLTNAWTSPQGEKRAIRIKFQDALVGAVNDIQIACLVKGKING